MPGTSTNQLPLVQAGTSGYTTLSGVDRLAVDTELASGAAPQSVAATSFQVAAVAAALSTNTATLSSNTATLNTRSGLINTTSLSTAAGSTYAFTIVNSLASPVTTPFQLVVVSGGTTPNTTAGVAIQSASIGTAGTISATIVNNGTAALNGTLLIPFQVGVSV